MGGELIDGQVRPQTDGGDVTKRLVRIRILTGNVNCAVVIFMSNTG